MGTSGSRPSSPGKSPIVPPSADQDGKGPGPDRGPRPFKQFRTKLGQFAVSGDRDDLKTGLGHYARTSLGGGGGKHGTRRMARAINAGAGLLALVANVAGGGTGEELLGFNLRDLAGQTAEDVIAAIVNALTPPGGPPDENEIREGMTVALAECLDEGAPFDPDDLDIETIRQLLQKYLAEEVFQRVLAESNGALNKSDDQVVNLNREEELRDFIQGVVDVVAGPAIRDLNISMNKNQFEKIMQEVTRAVLAEFENYF